MKIMLKFKNLVNNMNFINTRRLYLSYTLSVIMMLIMAITSNILEYLNILFNVNIFIISGMLISIINVIEYLLFCINNEENLLLDKNHIKNYSAKVSIIVLLFFFNNIVTNVIERKIYNRKNVNNDYT